jgi:hypothetical protein
MVIVYISGKCVANVTVSPPAAFIFHDHVTVEPVTVRLVSRIVEAVYELKLNIGVA